MAAVAFPRSSCAFCDRIVGALAAGAAGRLVRSWPVPYFKESHTGVKGRPVEQG
jgi:hypothetical protein